LQPWHGENLVGGEGSLDHGKGKKQERCEKAERALRLIPWVWWQIGVLLRVQSGMKVLALVHLKPGFAKHPKKNLHGFSALNHKFPGCHTLPPTNGCFLYLNFIRQKKTP